jgi:hypothetical protein
VARVTAQQVAVNHKALMEAAVQLEAAGYQGDAFRFVESLVRSVLADGYREIPKPPPLTGRGSSDDARRAIVEQTKRELADRKRHRTAAGSDERDPDAPAPF